MINGEAQSIHDALRDLATTSVIMNEADDYPAFGVLVGNRFRIAVHVGREGATFFTEDRSLLDRLESNNVLSHAIVSDWPRDKHRYQFPNLSTKQIDENRDDFSKLVSDSIKMKEDGD